MVVVQYSVRILQKNCFAGFWEKKDILQDLPEQWMSCKNCKNVSSYLPVFGYPSDERIQILQDSCKMIQNLSIKAKK